MRMPKLIHWSAVDEGEFKKTINYSSILLKPMYVDCHSQVHIASLLVMVKDPCRYANLDLPKSRDSQIVYCGVGEAFS